jgi:carnitine O-acetyltransferase
MGHNRAGVIVKKRHRRHVKEMNRLARKAAEAEGQGSATPATTPKVAAPKAAVPKPAAPAPAASKPAEAPKAAAPKPAAPKAAAPKGAAPGKPPNPK